MSNIHQSSNRIKNRPWAALLPVLLLAPLAMAPKGCAPVVIGNDCPEDMVCTAGSAGGDPVMSAGAAGKPTGTGGSAGKPTGGSAGKSSGNGGSAGSVPSGGTCGGLLGSSCAATDYCAFDPAAACGAADQTGVCTPKPQACDAILAPVCACDGQTYSSDCAAEMAGSSVLHTGACDSSSGTTCGGFIAGTCAKSEYCNFPIATQCGSGDQTGTCTRIPDACTLQVAPVCGCDNVTYSNSCAAASKGVSVLHNGACDVTPGTVCGGLQGLTCPDGAFCNFPIEAKCGAGDQTGICDSALAKCSGTLDPVCGCDGKTYDNACIAHSQQVSVAAVGACSTQPTSCGGKLGGVCARNEYCNYPLSANCGRADATGTCSVIHTAACTANYDPVCGCNGMTYGNACEAGLAGMAISSKGECP